MLLRTSVTSVPIGLVRVGRSINPDDEFDVLLVTKLVALPKSAFKKPLRTPSTSLSAVDTGSCMTVPLRTDVSNLFTSPKIVSKSFSTSSRIFGMTAIDVLVGLLGTTLLGSVGRDMLVGLLGTMLLGSVGSDVLVGLAGGRDGVDVGDASKVVNCFSSSLRKLCVV